VWRWWRTAQEKASTFAATRSAQSDGEFLRDCGLSNDDESASAALAVRRSVAKYGMVDAQAIRAADRYPEELIALSGWDSIDLLAWVFELDAQLGVRVPYEQLFREFDVRAFQIRDLVKIVCEWHRSRREESRG
jgi:acyl carrier protein